MMNVCSKDLEEIEVWERLNLNVHGNIKTRFWVWLPQWHDSCNIHLWQVHMGVICTFTEKIAKQTNTESELMTW